MPRLKALVAEILGDPGLAAGIADDADLVDELGLDSVQMIRFLLGTEDAFDLELDFEALELDHIRSVRLFAEFVLREVARAAP
ncbi:MAG: acyl carrier protein [Streptomycetaceae bacterium]|nr:acyl carrier protein [Streptomycetaceae bacterium]